MDQGQNTQLQNPNDILSSIQALAGSVSAPAPANIPSLNFVMPSASNLPAEYQKFLQDVANDPSIVNYYQQLLGYAKGDTDVAIQQLKTDYSTGVRQVTDTLKNSLQQLGIGFTGESNNMLDTLNKRGIALTQDGKKLSYAGGGQAATEVGNLNVSQSLRQEAEQRSAQQNIENAGLTRNKGITNANEALQNQAIGLQQQKQSDITGRANLAESAQQASNQLKAQQAFYAQQNAPSGGGSSGGGSPLAGASTATRQAAWTSAGNKGDLPAGWFG